MTRIPNFYFGPVPQVSGMTDHEFSNSCVRMGSRSLRSPPPDSNPSRRVRLPVNSDSGDVSYSSQAHMASKRPRIPRLNLEASWQVQVCNGHDMGDVDYRHLRAGKNDIIPISRRARPASLVWSSSLFSPNSDLRFWFYCSKPLRHLISSRERQKPVDSSYPDQFVVLWGKWWVFSSSSVHLKRQCHSFHKRISVLCSYYDRADIRHFPPPMRIDGTSSKTQDGDAQRLTAAGKWTYLWLHWGEKGATKRSFFYLQYVLSHCSQGGGDRLWALP